MFSTPVLKPISITLPLVVKVTFSGFHLYRGSFWRHSSVFLRMLYGGSDLC
jgi:hypothetical protein